MNNKSAKYQAVVAGHICLDLHPAFSQLDREQVRQMLVPGRLINMDKMIMSTGGAVSNTGQTLQQLGISTRLIGKVGQDYLGTGVRQMLSGSGANDNLIVDPDSSTSYSIVIAPPGVDRIFLHHPGANDTFSADDMDPQAIESARIFHFGYPPLMQKMYAQNGQELASLLKLVSQMGITTSLDMALPDPSSEAGKADWPEILARVLPLTDIFLPSIEELLYMLDRKSYEAIRQNAGNDDFTKHFDLSSLPRLSSRLISMGVKIAVIKLGKKGIYIRTAKPEMLAKMGRACPADIEGWANRELLSPANTVSNIASTSGAGDAGIAGFLAALLSGCTIESAIRAANAVAAQKIQSRESVGKISPLPLVLETMAKMPADKYESGMDTWSWQTDKRIWIGRNDTIPV